MKVSQKRNGKKYALSCQKIKDSVVITVGRAVHVTFYYTDVVKVIVQPAAIVYMSDCSKSGKILVAAARSIGQLFLKRQLLKKLFDYSHSCIACSQQ